MNTRNTTFSSKELVFRKPEETAHWYSAKMNKRGIVIVTLALLFMVLVVYAIISYSYVSRGETSAVIGERAAVIRDVSAKGDADLFVIEKSIDNLKVGALNKIGLSFDASKDISEQYLIIFKKDFENYVKSFDLSGLDYDYSVNIENNNIGLDVILHYDKNIVKYDISKSFSFVIDFSGFEMIKKECVDDVDDKDKKIKEIDGKKYCSDFYNGDEIKKKCGECIVSSDDKFLKFESEIIIYKEKIPLKYQIEVVKGL